MTPTAVLAILATALARNETQGRIDFHAATEYHPAAAQDGRVRKFCYVNQCIVGGCGNFALVTLAVKITSG
jgi:hypothetical protein